MPQKSGHFNSVFERGGITNAIISLTIKHRSLKAHVHAKRRKKAGLVEVKTIRAELARSHNSTAKGRVCVLDSTCVQRLM
jgi:succinyl-CoA synthetase beta subunit